jgi:hypothetical protein
MWLGLERRKTDQRTKLNWKGREGKKLNLTKRTSPRPTTPSPVIQDEREPTRRKGDQGCGTSDGSEREIGLARSVRTQPSRPPYGFAPEKHIGLDYLPLTLIAIERDIKNIPHWNSCVHKHDCLMSHIHRLIL